MSAAIEGRYLHLVTERAVDNFLQRFFLRDVTIRNLCIVSPFINTLEGSRYTLQELSLKIDRENHRRNGAPALSNLHPHRLAPRHSQILSATGIAFPKASGRTSELMEQQRGLARSLAGCAAERWSRIPTHKQAKHGAKMIDAARSSGAL